MIDEVDAAVQGPPARRPRRASPCAPPGRTALTTLGSAAILLGTFLPWTRSPSLHGQDWSVRLFNLIVGTVTILLAVLALFGFTGRTGRLTRAAAVLCLVFLGLLLAAVNVQANAWPRGRHRGRRAGVCVTAFVGGFLARR